MSHGFRMSFDLRTVALILGACALGSPGFGCAAEEAPVDTGDSNDEASADDGDDERDVTVKRFPYWGDAADLVEVISAAP